MTEPMDCVVVGGGISGLTCGYRLMQAGRRLLLLEAAKRVGGVIQSVQRDGFLFELGPQSFQSNGAILELIRDLGIEGCLLRADPRAPRYVFKGGSLHPVPMSPPALLTTRLLGLRTKWKLVSEPFRRTIPPAEDESIASFVRRKFGEDLLENLVGPFVSGVYAGDASRISFRSAFPSAYRWERNHGSLFRGAMKNNPAKNTTASERPSLCTFRAGLETLPRALADQMADCIWIGAQLRNLAYDRSRPDSFVLVLEREGQVQQLTARSVVLALPTEAAAAIGARVLNQGADILSHIEYAPVVVVLSGYRREDLEGTLDGFGFLVPRAEGLRMLGTVWSSSLFADRAPAGMVNMTTFVGGAKDPAAVKLSDGDLNSIVDSELARTMGARGRPIVRLVQRYERAIPQYNLGYSDLLHRLQQHVSEARGLFVTGNYLEGPSIATCVEQATRTAESVAQLLG